MEKMKRKYEIVNTNITVIELAEILQITAKITEYLGIRHTEKGEKIPRTRSRTIGVAIPVLDLPAYQKKAYIMNAVKTTYEKVLQSESEAQKFVGYTKIE